MRHYAYSLLDRYNLLRTYKTSIQGLPTQIAQCAASSHWYIILKLRNREATTTTVHISLWYFEVVEQLDSRILLPEISINTSKHIFFNNRRYSKYIKQQIFWGSK